MDAATLREGYRSFGLGVAPAMLAMFDQDPEGGGAAWEVGGPGTGLVGPAGEVAAYDLFGGEQPGWEIVRVEPNDFMERRDTIVVTGHVLWRPKGGWEVMPGPFCHIWTLRDGRVSVVSYLDGIELQRVEEPTWRRSPEPRAARGGGARVARWHPWLPRGWRDKNEPIASARGGRQPAPRGDCCDKSSPVRRKGGR